MVADKKAVLKKKKWVDILAPKLFQEVPVGQTYVEDTALLLGKRIRANLMTITGEPRKQSTCVFLDIVDQRENAVGTKIVGLEVSQSSLRRIIKKGKRRIDERVVAKSTDGKKVEVKLFIATAGLAPNSTMTAIRKGAKLALLQKIESSDFEQIITAAISGALQKEVREKIKKVYPLAAIEVRKVSIIPEVGAEGKAAELQVEAKAEEAPVQDANQNVEGAAEEKPKAEKKPRKKKAKKEDAAAPEATEEEKQEEAAESASQDTASANAAEAEPEAKPE